VQTDDARTAQPEAALDLKIGEVVEVRSPSEILATLDERGRLGALPFMPEMLQFAGKQLRVSKRAFKTCDQVKNSGMYRMERTVHLEGVRCDGSAHGGCQAGCLIFWKEGWLKRAEPHAAALGDQKSAEAPLTGHPSPPVEPRCTVETLTKATQVDAETYSCQVTELPKAAPTRINAWDLRQYVEDVTSGNARMLPTLRGVLVRAFNKYQKLSKRVLPRRLWIHHGNYYPFIDGKQDGRTPKETLDLQPGELVEVKSREEIFETLDSKQENRGLRFDVEGLRYCGKRARVLRRVDKIIDETNGKMINIKGDCIVLDGFVCAADYHQNCPRAIPEYWREIWLRRV
jgi:hypothetical protein